MSNKYSFYFDESFHSRLINEKTIIDTEYFDNYVMVGLGIENRKKHEIEKLLYNFENEAKNRLSITPNSELKSKVVSKKQYKYGLKTFNKKSLEFYTNFWKLLKQIDYIPYIYVSNKLEYLLVQIKYKNNKYQYYPRAFIYSIVKAINVYRPQKILKMLLNNDNKIIREIKDFLIKKIKENYNNPIKVQEKRTFGEIVMILNECDDSAINYKWSYDNIFIGLKKLIDEIGISITDVDIYVDKEGKDNNTCLASKINGFFNTYELDSKNCIEIRCCDIMCGFISRMMRAIYDDTKIKDEKYIEKIVISKEWFEIDERAFELYKTIVFVLEKKFCYRYNSYISSYFDNFFMFILIINYFNNYSTYTEYKKYDSREHRKMFERYSLINLNEKLERLQEIDE